jgi:tetratricopeptide (TPR) repeat protein
MSHRDEQQVKLSASAIGGWIEGVKDRSLSLGPSVTDATTWAEGAWSQVLGGSPLACDSSWNSSLADRLFALSAVLSAHGVTNSQHVQAAAADVFESLLGIEWQADLIGEKASLMGRFAFLVWACSFRCGMYAQLGQWEDRIAELALLQVGVPEFLSVRPAHRSAELNSRFFREPAVLLATCLRMERIVNSEPAEVYEDAIALRAWLLGGQEVSAREDEVAYVVASLEIMIAITKKFAGRYREAHAWVDGVSRLCEKVRGGELLKAKARFVRLAIFHECRQYEAVLEEIPGLRSRFQEWGRDALVARCDYLGGVANKELSNTSEAIERLRAVVESDRGSVEPWLRGYALIDIADVLVGRCEFEEAQAALAAAWPMVKNSKQPGCVAHYHAVKGQLLRDQGLWMDAIDSYRASVEAYGRAQFESMAAYLRVLLAEALLAVNREDEAVQEILVSLPKIEELELVPEGVAAAAILRESIRRRRADREALRILRLQVQGMGRGRH